MVWWLFISVHIFCIKCLVNHKKWRVLRDQSKQNAWLRLLWADFWNGRSVYTWCTLSSTDYCFCFTGGGRGGKDWLGTPTFLQWVKHVFFYPGHCFSFLLITNVFMRIVFKALFFTYAFVFAHGHYELPARVLQHMCHKNLTWVFYNPY